MAKLFRWLGLAIWLVVIDQGLKTFLGKNLQLNSLGAFSFSWGANSKLVWLILPATTLLIMWLYLIKSTQLAKTSWPAWSLIWGGGLSNWLDRVIYGGVRDIWPIYATNLKNNLADYALTFGIIWLMIDWLWKSTQKPKKFL